MSTVYLEQQSSGLNETSSHNKDDLVHLHLSHTNIDKGGIRRSWH